MAEEIVYISETAEKGMKNNAHSFLNSGVDFFSVEGIPNSWENMDKDKVLEFADSIDKIVEWNSRGNPIRDPLRCIGEYSETLCACPLIQQSKSGFPIAVTISGKESISVQAFNYMLEPEMVLENSIKYQREAYRILKNISGKLNILDN